MAPSDDEIRLKVADDLPVGVWVARVPKGEFVYANKMFAEILGMPGHSGPTIGEYSKPYSIHTRTGEPYPEDRMPIVRAIEARATVVVDDIVIHRHDGRKAYIRAQAKPVFEGDDQGGEREPRGDISHVVIAFIDITREVEAELARAETEARLQRAQRLESIGQLAGGIAHDFNNLLATIKLVAEALHRQERDPRKKQDLVLIDEVTEHAVRLTSSLLGFAGRGKNLATRLSPGLVVGSMRELIRRTLDRRIEVSFDLRATSDVSADLSQLEQVIMNLVVNARDAIDGPGTIALRTDELALDETTRRRFPKLAPGRYVAIEVSDSGSGIAPEVQHRIFEPYFTTKTSGDKKGTGLGLATVYGIVDAHGGGIEFESNAPRGTTFRIVLPALRGPSSSPLPAAARRARPTRRGEGTILVVEDEVHVRNSCARALEAIGYSVLAAGDGDEAVELFKEKRAAIRAVVLDMIMPRLGGRETYLALRAIDADVRVLLTTGFALNEEAQGILDLGVREFLAKPYDMDSLALALERIIPSG